MKAHIIRDIQEDDRIPEAGRIRVGEKRKNAQGKEYPASVDHFVASGDYAEKFHEVYPRADRITIVFPSDSEADVCNERFEARNEAGRLLGWGDGIDFMIFNKDHGKYLPYSIRQDENKEADRAWLGQFAKEGKRDRDGKPCGKWEEVLYIRFLIPAVRSALGYWQLMTKGSKTSIPNIRGVFNRIKGESIAHIPLDLFIDLHTSNMPESTSKYPVLKLVPNISNDRLLLIQELHAANKLNVRGLLTSEVIDKIESMEAKNNE